MSFNLYNSLSQLVPGFILLIIVVHILKLDINTIPALPSTAVAYVLGYFINAIGGWTESIMFKSWGGEPATQLLEGKRCGRIKFSESGKLKGLVGENTENKKLFQITIRLANGNDLVKEMNASYIFSRSIFVTMVIGYLALSYVYFNNSFFHIASIIMIVMAWYRAKERGFYYVKEVLRVSINILEKESIQLAYRPEMTQKIT